MAGSFAITIYYCYEWRDPNAEKKRWLKIKKYKWKLCQNITNLGDEVHF